MSGDVSRSPCEAFFGDIPSPRGQGRQRLSRGLLSAVLCSGQARHMSPTTDQHGPSDQVGAPEDAIFG